MNEWPLNRNLANWRHSSLGVHVVVVGASLGGIFAAAHLARAGHTVTVYEKDSCVGGRARGLVRDGFRFEVCPTWYWKPAEHDRWFAEIGASRTEHYDMRRVDPNAGEQPSGFFGLWYPDGGFAKVVESMYKVAQSHGVRFVLTTEVTGTRSSGGRTSRVYVRSNCDEDEVHADAVVAGSDYLYAENKQPTTHSRLRFMEKWSRKRRAPAVLNYYVGLNKKLPSLAQRSFFCDPGWDEHRSAVRATPSRQGVPLFYLDIPTIADPSRAPEGHEALTVAVPCVPGIEDSAELREQQFTTVLDRIEKASGESLHDAVVFRESSWLGARNTSRKSFRYNPVAGSSPGLLL